METFPEEIVLSYAFNSGKEDDVHITVTLCPLERTPCDFGGFRYWFVCPSRGCGRRVNKL